VNKLSPSVFGNWERVTMWMEKWKAVSILERAVWKGSADQVL